MPYALTKTIQRNIPKAIARARRLPAHLRASWCKYVRRKPFWYTDRNGITLELKPEDNLAVYFRSRLLFDDIGTIALLRRIIKPGLTVLDVGAHMGAFALFVANLLQGRGVVHAFEPTRSSYQRLARNVAYNQRLATNIILNQLAVADTDGELVLHTFPPQYSAWNTLGQPELADEHNRKRTPTATEKVRSVTVDAYCRSRFIERVDLLKIDVEGFEDNVIHGCSELLRQAAIPWVIFEISLAPLKGSNKTPGGILTTFAQLGFTLFRIEEDGALSPVGAIDRFEAPFFANYFGVHAGATLPDGVLIRTA